MKVKLTWKGRLFTSNGTLVVIKPVELVVKKVGVQFYRRSSSKFLRIPHS